MAKTTKIPRELMGAGGAPADSAGQQAVDRSLPPELGGASTTAADNPNPPNESTDQPVSGTVQVSTQEMPQLDGAQQGDKFVAEIITDNGDGTYEIGYAADQTL
jgi:hypothetical protein